MTHTEQLVANYFIQKEGENILDSIKEIDFIDSGIIDSLDLINLAVYIEETFNLKLNLVDESTFNSIRQFDSLVKLIETSKS
jgi:acyl carrier protein